MRSFLISGYLHHTIPRIVLQLLHKPKSMEEINEA
jgi:hypothetical protein